MAAKNVLELIENKYDVTAIVTSKGTPVWPLIRQAVYFKVLQKSVQYNNKLRTRNKLQLAKNFFHGCWNIFRLKKFEYVFFNNSDKRTSHNEKMFDIYYDAWADVLGQEKSIFIEWAIIKHLPKEEVYSKHVLSDLPLKVLASTLSQFVHVKIHGEDILDDILKEHKIQLNVQKELKTKFGNYRAYRILFRMIKPKAVFVVSSFTKIGEVFAAKKLGIPVYEAQHGYVGDTHPFYHTNQKFPEFYPDYLISFGHSEKERNKPSLIFNPEKIISVGSLQLDLVKQRELTAELLEFKNSYKTIFCVTLQVIQDERIVNWVIEQAKRHDDWLFILRPKQPNTTFELYNTANNVIELPEVSTYDVLKASDYNITIFSTTVVEGAYLGAKPILFDIDDLPRKYFDLENSNIALIENNQRISQEHLSKAGTFQTPYFVENYFINVSNAAKCF